MAKFIFGNMIRKRVAPSGPVTKLLWFLDLLFIGSVFALLRVLPVDVAAKTGQRFGRWLGPKFRKKSAIINTNLRQVLPEYNAEQIDELTAQVWGNAGTVFAEYAHLSTICDTETGQRLEVVNLGDLETFRNPKRPMVIATAHLANWETVAAAVATTGSPFIALFSPPANPWLDRLLSHQRAVLGCELLSRDANMRSLMRALEQGKSIGMVMDRRVDNGKPVNFFGQEMATTLLPARLALRYGCDLVPVRTERMQNAHYKVTFYPPIEPASVEEDVNAQALDMVKQVNALFEDWIRQNPQDWLCTKRLWPKQTVPLQHKGAALGASSSFG